MEIPALNRPVMRRGCQYLLLLLTSLMMITFVLVNIQLRDEGSLRYLELINQLSLNVTSQNSLNSSTCIIPPFNVVFKDLKYRKSFHKKSPYPCLQSQPPLTYLESGMFRWNKTSLAALEAPPSCYVRFLSRKEGSDEEVVASDKFPVPVGEDRRYGASLIHVMCHGVRGGLVYQNIHFNILARKLSVNTHRHSKASAEKPRSIFLLLIESLSRVNAHVQLPKTLKVLKSEYNSTFLHGNPISPQSLV